MTPARGAKIMGEALGRSEGKGHAKLAVALSTFPEPESAETHSPAAILSAYAGVLLCDFSDMHAYIDSLPGCSDIMTLGLAELSKSGRLRELIKESGDFDAAMQSLLAAPDLLEALKFIVNDGEPGEDAVLSVKGYNLACAAIAKATVAEKPPAKREATTPSALAFRAGVLNAAAKAEGQVKP